MKTTEEGGWGFWRGRGIEKRQNKTKSRATNAVHRGVEGGRSDGEARNRRSQLQIQRPAKMRPEDGVEVGRSSGR